MASRPAPTRLELARLGAGLQQQELARLIGITPGRLSTFERGNDTPNTEQQIALAAALGYPSSSLFPTNGSRISESALRLWIISLNDEGSAGRPSLVNQSPGRGRRAEP